MSIKFDETNLQGLTGQEALERLAQDGYNELPTAKKRTIFHIVLEAVRKPMFLMLIACGVLYLLLGDREETSILLGFIVGNIGITLYQELCLQSASVCMVGFGCL
jgi:Ca2+-transporting ATPase